MKLLALLAGVWFPGSAWEPYVFQALPAFFVSRDPPNMGHRHYSEVVNY